jgi:hypothetical protein
VRLHENLLHRVADIHGTIVMLEDLQEFPFGYLYRLGEMEFWRLVFRNFGETAIVGMHALVNDQEPGSLTLSSLNREVMQAPCLDEKNKLLFQEIMRENKFDGFAKRIAERVRLIRHNFAAHQIVDTQRGLPKETLASVRLGDLRKLFDAAHSLFGALSFGSAFVTLRGDLAPSFGGKPSKTCLDRLLDAVLRDSDFVNQPERRKEHWELDRQFMNPERLGIMNRLRKRIGLSEV